MDEKKIYHWCGKCGAILNDQPGYIPGRPLGTCAACGAGWYSEDLYQGERFEGVFWHCKKCDALLNIQDGFSDLYDNWKCTVCSHINRIEESEIDDFTMQFEVNNEDLVKRNWEKQQESESDKQKNDEQKSSAVFCINCGNKIDDSAKFCNNCGSPVYKETSSSTTYSERKVSYDGEIKKCPNCGEILNSFTPNCPLCGYELRNAKTANYVYSFSRMLEQATSVQQKEDLIRHFVIPNTKEDIYEFMILAASNVETNGQNIDAWFVKLEQAYQKARLIWTDSTDIKIVESIYLKASEDYKKVRRANSFSSFFRNHTKGVVIFILGILATICYSISSIGYINKEYQFSVFSSFGFAFCIVIIILAIKWKRKGG